MTDHHYLGFRSKELANKGGLDTAMEITGQLALWKAIYKLVRAESGALKAFLKPLLAIKDLRIILTGAGSSAFIGEAAQGIVQTQTGNITQAIAMTDLVTHPSLFFIEDIPTLLVSFARSGNSPESCEAIRLAELHCKKVFHLIITCNRNGDLARLSTGKNMHTFLLPEESNDMGLAMTGSFTGMLLAIVLISKLDHIDLLEKEVNELTRWAGEILENYLPGIRDISDAHYERVIFLGSGPLLGIARECHLKLQEMTDGKVICKHDSFLGFRHGPRAVANKQSLLVYLFSADEKAFQYERDLALSVSLTTPDIPVIAVGRDIDELNNKLMTIDRAPANTFGFIGYTLIGQLMGFYQSLRLGLRPDRPSVSGNIHRVVQGVTIYL